MVTPAASPVRYRNAYSLSVVRIPVNDAAGS